MTLTDIVLFALLAPLLMWGLPSRWRSWAIFAGSVLAVGWLQYRGTGSFDGVFELAALTVLLTALVWWVVQPAQVPAKRRIHDRWTLLACVGLLGGIWVVTGLESGDLHLTPVLSASVLLGVGVVSVSRTFPLRTANPDIYRRLAWLLIGVIVLVLVVLKTPPVARYLNALTSGTTFTEVTPLVWLGISYVAFRLIALLRDFQYGRLPEEGYALRDVMTYVLFFPAYTAGPIDRSQRFIPELHTAQPLNAVRLVDGSMRIAVGVFKKFVVADSLALLSMEPTLIDRTESTLGLWLLLYIYAFQIYFDFSGYSDVAIGLGKLYGLTLPENFDRPYLAPNIQQFWNRWHITLSLWFRGYYFTPLSRAMIRLKLPRYTDVFFAQLSTMVLIGLWHGVTANFVLWGAWHGIGLFAYKVIADYTRRWHRNLTQQRPAIRRVFLVGSILLTFHFVVLGWVFFALPAPADSVDMLIRLFGG